MKETFPDRLPDPTPEQLADMNPGSHLAIGYGCKCPILDNRHGEGYGPNLWIISRACPLHGELKSVLQLEREKSQKV